MTHTGGRRSAVEVLAHEDLPVARRVIVEDAEDPVAVLLLEVLGLERVR